MVERLLGYIDSNKILVEEGTLIGQNGEPFSVTDVKKYIDYYTVEKLATALSRSIRYLGNSKMTNAQHCVRGAECLMLMGKVNEAYTFLFHEISEPFGIADISTPVKKTIKHIIKPMEDHIESTLADKFGYIYPFPSIIKEIDINLAVDETTMMKHGYLNFDYWDEVKSYNQFMMMHDKLNLYKYKY